MRAAFMLPHALILMALSQLKNEPLDAFRANFAAIRAELSFDYVEGPFKNGGAALWKGGRAELVENSATRVIGRWACDGKAEYYHFSSSPEILERAAKDQVTVAAGKASFSVRFVAKTEALWDGEILCIHEHNPHVIDGRGLSRWGNIEVKTLDREPFLFGGRGPFHWGFTTRFPEILKIWFPNAKRSGRRVLRCGHPTDLEVYRREEPGEGWLQLEVAYDLDSRHVPRFARFMSVNAKEDIAFAQEFYLIEARPCASGGFVPTEYYTRGLTLNDFRKQYPEYNDETELTLPDPGVGGGHFRASNFRDFQGSVALTDVREVRRIDAVGGSVELPADPVSLSLDQIKTLLGGRLAAPGR
jgi:hypothetical protein